MKTFLFLFDEFFANLDESTNWINKRDNHEAPKDNNITPQTQAHN